MNLPPTHKVRGAGLGLRRAMLGPLGNTQHAGIDFMEVAPENWINVGGRLGKQFRATTEMYPFVLHGLSLSLGGPAAIDVDLVKNIKRFMDDHGIDVYTEHLSYCSDDGHLYDLMPIPFTSEAVDYVAERIRLVQDILERPMAVENVSYYAAPAQELAEVEFLNAVLQEADCGLLLDVNNVYVNSVNHRYDPDAFLQQMPADRITYFHVAGHYNEAEDLLVDTHGADVIDPVWTLLEQAYRLFGVKPTLLERDFNIPPLQQLLEQVSTIRQMQSRFSSRQEKSA